MAAIPVSYAIKGILSGGRLEIVYIEEGSEKIDHFFSPGDRESIRQIFELIANRRAMREKISCVGRGLPPPKGGTDAESA
jgi:hypothetical protein